MLWDILVIPLNLKKFKVEGKNKEDQKNLLNQSKQIEKAGAFSIVLECISKKASKKLLKN